MDLQGEKAHTHSAAIIGIINRCLGFCENIRYNLFHLFPALFSYNAPIKLLLIFQARGYGVNVQLTPQH